MEKETNWYLIRLGSQSGIYKLKNGITSIGRNRKADIIAFSDICSRNHSTIAWNTNELTIKNASDNGTYVNENRIDECKLKEGDKIGLGCDYTVLTLNVPNPEKYYVFELVKNYVTKPIDVILISDEEDERDLISANLNIVTSTNDEIQNNARSDVPSASGMADSIGQNNATDTISTAGKSNRDVDSTGNNACLESSKSLAAIKTSSDNHQIANESPIFSISDDEDENEFNFSQQCVMQLKQEVNDSDKAPNWNDDFHIEHADDDDIVHDQSFSTWIEKLSQDQDIVIKKINQSTEHNKRKATKLIEAVPEKKRKHSHDKDKVSDIAKSKQSHTNTASKTNHDKQVEILMTVSTCDASKARPTTHSIDRRAVKEPEPSVSFGEMRSSCVPNTIAQQKKKIRIAHRPKSSAQQTPSASNTEKADTSKSRTRKKKKRVRFADDFGHRLSNIIIFEPKEYEDDEFLIAPSAVLSFQPNEPKGMKNDFENDPLHEIITDITEWRTEWITLKLTSPPMNEIRSIVPAMDVYLDYQNYKDVMLPLLKHELWSSIMADTSNKGRFGITIDDRSLAMRASRKRYVFNTHVNVESNSPKVFVGDFILIESNNCPSFFAYVTSQQFTRNSRVTYFAMEASETVVNLPTTQPTIFYATPIANIRSELKQFSAILYLEKTPFKDVIINPIKNALSEPKKMTEAFEYTGYDGLNTNQLEILQKIQMKCITRDHNLSLIEGPPGTGKTRLITGIILQLLFGKGIVNPLRILVLTSSNAAIDIIARKLIRIREKIEDRKKKNILNVVRYGVLNSMHPEVRCIAPQNIQENFLAVPQFESDQVKSFRMQSDHLSRQIESECKKSTKNNSIVADRIDNLRKRLIRINNLIKEYTDQQHPDDIKIIMRDARVVCSTLSSAINIKPFVKNFDVCIIDEASQCTESWSMVPLQYQITSFILVGDSKQLSPVVLSQVCRNNGMERSLFTRLFDSTTDNELNKYSLTTQYRMHPEICSFPNKYFYENRLKCADGTKCDSFKLEPYTVFSLDFKQSNQDAVNYHNTGEAQFIVDLLKVLEKLASPKSFSYGLITPYAKQKAEIQQYIQKSKTLSGYDFPVNTIDSYQGQEKDIIILSTARTTGVGFLANPQRLNVALTRAKKCLIICGNFTSVANIRVWKELLKDAKQRNKLHAIPNSYDFDMIANFVKKNMRTANPEKPNK